MPNEHLSAEDKAILTYLSVIEKEGLQITDRDGMLKWFKAKIAQGAKLQEIKDLLRVNNFDFEKVDKLLDEKLESRSAIKKVKALETKIEGEEHKKKVEGQLSFVVTAFMIAIVAAGSSWFISRQVSDIDTSVIGETGGILTTFIKAGWVIGIAAGFVGLLLLTMFLSDKLKDKSIGKKKESSEPK